MPKIRIAVLMSTYNGERFLCEQIDSILSQEGDFELSVFIRDDGSTDHTISILQSYQYHSCVDVIYGNNIGVNASLMDLINHIDTLYDYYSISDQDDVWYKYRLQTAINYLKGHEQQVSLWSCMEELADQEMKVYASLPLPKHLGEFYNAMLQNKTPGHTQVFNQKLFELLRGYPASKMYLYDRVIYMIACAFGQVLYAERSCGRYRQHTSNEMGFDHNNWKVFLHRIKVFMGGQFEENAKQLKFFSEYYADRLDMKIIKEIESFLYSRQTFLNRVRYSINTKVICDSRLELLFFRVAYILGAFGEDIG